MALMRSRRLALALLLALPWRPGAAQSKVAEGCARLPEGATVVVMPMEVELFSVTAGGVNEPKADWTEQGRNNLAAALLASGGRRHVKFLELPAGADAGLDELRHLHQAVARAILLHHVGPWKLPSKGGRLDWSLGEEARAIRSSTQADYALFLRFRDSYATGGRVAAVAVMAVFGVVAANPGGYQYGYADLVDLDTGKIVWFNQLLSRTGDVREPAPARETLDKLMAGFPE